MNHPHPDVATSAEKLLLWLPDGLKAAARPSLASSPYQASANFLLHQQCGSEVAITLPGLWGGAGRKGSSVKTGQYWRVGSEFAC